VIFIPCASPPFSNSPPLYTSTIVPTLAAGSGIQPGIRQHVHQDLVGPHRLHQEGGQEGQEEGTKMTK